MADRLIRSREIDAILSTLAAITDELERAPRILEVGCGNGTLLERLHEAGYREVVGTDHLDEFVALAVSRGLPFEIRQADVRHLPFGSSRFDAVVSERVLVNLRDPLHQGAALAEIRRVLRGGGYAVFVEAFEDALHELNAARAEVGLGPLPMWPQNRWFRPGEMERFSEGIFAPVDEIGRHRLVPRNFLSTHYFVSRVLHPLLLDLRASLPDRFEGPVRNTRFVEMLSSVLPAHGNYASIQFVCLRAT
jgi:SAM-dependent methyltransferase